MTTFNKHKKMVYQNLGSTGIQVSKLSFGCMTFGSGKGFSIISSASIQKEAAYEMMRVCYENGVNFFDNAETYGGGGESEIAMGEAIQIGLQKKTWERCDLIISTKIFFGGRNQAHETHNSHGLSRKHLVEGIKASLKRMQLDYVDLIFCHRPDTKVTIEETVRAMNWIIDQGLAFYWGTSEWSAQQLQEAIGIAESLGMIPPQFDQCQYSLVERHRVEIEYQPLYHGKYKLGTTIWSPLAGGVLSGKYKNTTNAENVSKADRYSSIPALLKSENKRLNAWGKILNDRLQKALSVAEAIKPIAKELGCSPAVLAIAWCAVNPHVSTVLLGATRMEQIHENFKALEVIPKLTADVMKRIDEATGNKPRLDEIMKMVSDTRGPYPWAKL